MKLPSITNKPVSATSQRQSKNNVISSLEKNLLNKLNEYDELNRLEENIKQDTKMEIQPKSKPNLSVKQNINIVQPLRTYVPKSVTQKIEIKKENPQKIEFKSETVFLTGQIESKLQEEPQNDSDDDNSSIDELVNNQSSIAKQKKLIIDFQDDSDVGQLNKMIYQTQNELDDQFSNIYQLKQTIDAITLSQRLSGFSIDNQLLEDLNKQFKQMIILKKETQAIEEYNIREMSTNKHNKMPTLRSGSVANQKKPSQKVNTRSKDTNY